MNRSLLTATAAAMLAGPFAAAGAAQTLDDLTKTVEMTCEEALKTEDAKLIDQFCTAEEIEALSSPLTKSVDEVTKTVEKTKTEVEKKVAPKKDEPEDKEETGGTGNSSPTDKVLGDAEGKTRTDNPTKGNDVGATGEKPRGIDDNVGGGSGSAAAKTDPAKADDAKAAAARGGARAENPGLGFNTDGPFRPGMQSNSSLTLQPFAAPLVSVPPVYELPQVAQQLFGSTTGVTAEDPQVAAGTAAATDGTTATAASPYSPTGYTATSADPTGWLAATATGLIMLVGAGHALNGGRKPSRSKA